MSAEQFEPKRLGEVYLPDYSGRSLYNLSHTLLKAFGAPVDQGISGLGDVLNHSRIVVLLIDGLGHRQLVSATGRIPAVGSSLSRAKLSLPITSVFPSTTSTVLTTLNTGLVPAKHGVIGFTMYVKELGSVVNSISFSPASERGRGRLSVQVYSHPTYTRREQSTTSYPRGVCTRVWSHPTISRTPCYPRRSIMGLSV
ncbi:hypothetical protein B9Q03_06130 [Candidatus Marsarchaeota G2 archaeon OSP_D]|jgi:Uncharacterized proteins of the AP superfamily|uniref:Metalloenzyme domain-containing protein n=1 Tax=Candidatus Marsarchaeota G2 archaeon OSP_D TaxID=1978157 RepID=A0A2R6AWK5_9ARCH|nr:MAG: hypothetical protein B9Q03_06130 [Candidatus Marsarchaeota G2 archaeon OSP_D]